MNGHLTPDEVRRLHAMLDDLIERAGKIEAKLDAAKAGENAAA